LGQPKERNYGAGQILFRQGEVGGDLYFLQSGKVELSVHTARTGLNAVVATVEAPTVLGTMTFLEGDTRSATAKALTEVKALIVDTEQREKLLGSVPDWLRALIKDLSLNLRRLNMEYTDLKSENEELKERLRRLEALSRREV